MTDRASGLVTIVFTDLVGSTEGRVRLGEDAAETLRRLHDRLVATAFESNGGQVVKHLGDGVMAVFTGAAEAVAAAVAAQRSLDRHNRSARDGERLDVRVGLSAGDVTFEKDDMFGTPVIEAARLCAAARGGQILAAEVVRILAGGRGGHRFSPAGALELKGLPEALPTVEVDWAPDSASPVPLPVGLRRTGTFRFSGRQAELEELGLAWKLACSGERRMVLVSGEAGIGKTRLVSKAARAFHAEGAVVLHGRCEEELGIPYGPFAEALAAYIAVCPPHELRNQMGPLGGEVLRLVPGLAERVPDLPEPLRSEPGTERYRLMEAVCELLGRMCDATPVVLVLDDLHWAAQATLHLLGHIAHSAAPSRLLVLATYRDTDLGRSHPLTETLAGLRRLPGVERLQLTGLDASAAIALFEATAGQALDPNVIALARVVAAETEGNPFFMGEVLRHLVETGAVEQRDGRWIVGRPVDDVGIPQGVREVVGHRLSRLADEANEVLASAAVIGREFDVALLGQTVDVGQDAMLDALEQAEEARLVVAVPARPGRYSFAHALVRSTLYDEMPSSRRLRLHRRIGLALEARAGALAAELAHHFGEAAALGESDRAVAYSRAAGDRAREGLAFEEAATHYEAALTALDFSAEPDRRLRCDLHRALGSTLFRARDGRYRRVLAVAAEEARALGDARRLAEVALAADIGMTRPAGVVDEQAVLLAEEALAALPANDDPLRARLSAVLAVELTWRSDHERRLGLCREALGMARRLGERTTLARVLASQQWAAAQAGNLEERIGLADELVALAAELGDTELSYLAHRWRWACGVEAGDIVTADAHLEAGHQLVEQLHQPVMSWEIHFGLIIQALLAGRLEDAEPLIEQVRGAARVAGVPRRAAEGSAASVLFMLRYEQGRLPEIAEEIERVAHATALPTYEAILAWYFAETGRLAEAAEIQNRLVADGAVNLPRDMLWLAGMTALARVASAAGDRPRAALILEALRPYAERHAYAGPAVFGPVAPVLGLLAALLERDDEAESHFSAGVEFCRRSPTPTWAARTQCEWAEMLVARGAPGDAERARELAGQALAAAEPLGMTGVAARARKIV